MLEAKKAEATEIARAVQEVRGGGGGRDTQAAASSSRGLMQSGNEPCKAAAVADKRASEEVDTQETAKQQKTEKSRRAGEELAKTELDKTEEKRKSVEEEAAM